MALDVSIVIEFDSRWRVGTGTARSNAVDNETWVDGSGHIVVPASHLKRRLRAQAEQLTVLLGWQGLCDGRLAGALTDPEEPEGSPSPTRIPACPWDAPQPCVLCRLFGAPRFEPCWRFSSARLDLGDRRLPVEEQDLLRRHERRASTHNAVDPWARRVAEDLLFTLEAARAGVRLAATAHLLGPAKEEDRVICREVALLVGAVGFLDSLGARSRRGYGRCRAWVEDAPLGFAHDQWVDELLAMPVAER